MEQECEERLEYIESQVKLCLKESRKEYNKARKEKDWNKVNLERRSIVEYQTVLSIIENSEDKQRREYDASLKKGA